MEDRRTSYQWEEHLGNIKKFLAGGQLEPRTVDATKFSTDLCENIHIHYRNLRLDLSPVEMAYWRSAILSMGQGLEKAIETYAWREGDPNFLVILDFKFPVSANSDYYPDRMTLEWERDNTVHFHYRDLRIRMTSTEFVQMAEMFDKAIKRFRDRTEFPAKNIEGRAIVPIDSVEPYDNGHKPLNGEYEKSHREGIEYIKKLILEGKKIRPILVDETGQRLDGFKRYFAFRELGHKEISVIVDQSKSHFLCRQHNHDVLDEMTEPPCGRKDVFDKAFEFFENPMVLEFGATRKMGNWEDDGYSTIYLAYKVASGGLFTSVDNDYKAIETSRKLIDLYSIKSRNYLVVADAIQYATTTKDKWDIVYLDAWDATKDIELSQDKHLELFKALEDKLHDESIVIVDDTVTKGVKVLPYMESKGWKKVYGEYAQIWSRR